MDQGLTHNGQEISSLEIKKWFDTNYHIFVPEFTEKTTFSVKGTKVFEQFQDAKKQGIITKPVLTGPATFLWLGKGKEGFNKFNLVKDLTTVYKDLFAKLKNEGVQDVQLDEPLLVVDLDEEYKTAFKTI